MKGEGLGIRCCASDSRGRRSGEALQGGRSLVGPAGGAELLEWFTVGTVKAASCAAAVVGKSSRRVLHAAAPAPAGTVEHSGQQLAALPAAVWEFQLKKVSGRAASNCSAFHPVPAGDCTFVP